MNDVVGRRNARHRRHRGRDRGERAEEHRGREPRPHQGARVPLRRSSGLTISIDDVRAPPEKAAILDRYEREAEKAETQFDRGVITDDERRQKEIEIWTSATSEVGRAMEKTLSAMAFNPLDMMVDSGAKEVEFQQIRQIAGMKGLVFKSPRRDDPEADQVLLP